MRLFKLSRSLLAVMTAGTLALSACGLNSDDSASQDFDLPDEIVLAGTAPLSGTMGAYGTAQAGAFQAAAAYVNENLDGIAGRPIKLRIENDQSDPAVGVGLAQGFVEDEVAAIVFPSYSPMTDQVLPIYQRAGMIVSTGSPPVGEFNDIEKYPRIFSHAPDYDHLYNTLGPFLKASGITKMGVVVDDTPTTKGLLSRLENEFAENGVEIVGTETVPYGSTEFTTPLRKLRDADSEGLFALVTVGIAQIYDTLRGLNWKPEVINATAGTPWLDGLDAVGEFADIAFADCYQAIPVGEEQDPKMAEIIAYFAEKTGNSFPGQQHGIFPALNAILTYKYAVEEVNSLDPEKVAKAIEGFHDKEYLTPGNVVSFSETEHVGVQTSATCSLLPVTENGTPYVATSVTDRQPLK